MIRFISHLFKLSYEPCKGCEVLKQQLALANENSRRLEDTFINLLQPRVVETATQREVNPVKQNLNTFGKRREALEIADRNKANALRSSFVARPDEVFQHIPSKAAGGLNPSGNPGSIEQLEKELAIGGES
jgi:hypothetical protein